MALNRSTRRTGSRVAAWRALPAALLLSAHASPEPLLAQERGECRDGRIAEIVIENHSVFDISDPDRGGRFSWAYRLANGLHVPTRAAVVEREILFDVGDCYQVEVLRDSERLLRAFGFLADANVYGIRLPGGDVQVRVDTQDEWSTRVEPRVSSGGGMGLRGLRVVEDNLLGTGRHLSLFYDRSDDERVYGGAYSTPHLFQSRWNMALQLARTEVGYSYHESVTYPFVGETGRVAFRQAIDRRDRYFELLMPRAEGDLARIWVPMNREQLEVGAAFRWGAERYRHTLIGASLAAERVAYPEAPRFADEDEPATAPAQPSALQLDWTPVSSIRMVMLAGQRNVHYVRRRAVDTVNGTEDLQLGVEAEGSFGPTLPVVSSDRDVAIGLGLSAAGETSERLLAGGQISFEGRRSYDSLPGLGEWHDVLAELDLWTYYRHHPDSRHLWVAAFTALGGWHSRIPFQLTLGGDAGLRGYPRHVETGARRTSFSVEHRARLTWPLPEMFDLGTTAFFDVGKIWAGDVPFGTDSPVRASVGAGLRAAFPPGSRQTFRADVGVPVARNVGFGDVTVTIGMGQAIGRRSARRDPQIMRSTRYSITTSDFVTGAP